MSIQQPEPLHVLVVDDDVQLLRTLSDILRVRGYTPSTSSTGQEALRLARGATVPPAIALVDLKLPDMDGMEVVSELRRNSRETEILVLTGNASLESAVDALRQQSYDYLIKPVAPDRLLDALRNAGDRWLRRRAEEALRQGEERCRQLLESISDLVLVIEPDFCVSYASPSATKVLGSGPDELLGRNVLDLFQPAKNSDVSVPESLQEALAGTTVDFVCRHRDGSTRVLHVSVNCLNRLPGPAGMVLTARDLTEQRELEQQAMQAHRLESVGRLAGGIAHDFNNVLTVILCFAEIILGDLEPEEPMRASVEEIRIAGMRAANLTKQLLAFSRQQVLKPKVLDVSQSIIGMEKMLRRLLGADVDLTILSEPGLWNIKVDPSQVDQILINLAVNAREAMPLGGKLTIEIANIELDDEYISSHHKVLPGAYVMVAVSDTGTGMDKETSQRIFEPYFTTKKNGTGIGLATVFGIVKQSGGHIWVYSEPGNGTTFKVYFPMVRDAADARVMQRPSAESLRGSETILLVEDEDQVRALACSILRRSGYVVLEAPNGGEALLISEQHPARIHLLLTDVVLPRLSGRQLAERLTAMRPEMKVLFMSGYTDDAILQHGILNSGVAFLQKPLTPNALTHKVREVLGEGNGMSR